MSKLAHFPAVTTGELSALDDDEVFRGYRDGFAVRALASTSRSYRHGYRVGRNDRSGRVENWQRRAAHSLIHPEARP